MKMGFCWIFAIATLFTYTLTSSATERYVSPVGGHLAPFTDWAGAATNIQDAVDVAEAGDLIWVTNGIYATGGRVADGLLTNRVVVNKAVTVKSVNGPEQTIIEGRWDPVSTNGAAAVRGVCLGANATLDGFQVRKGATLLRVTADGCGGGVYCGAPSALVANCILSGNAAESQGGASFYGTLSNCVVSANFADYGGGCASNTIVRCKLAGNVASISGGGSYFCRLTSCLLIGNWASSSGGSSKDLLRNCTVTGNSASASVGGVGGGSLTNCIVWGNKAKSTPDIGTCTLSYCCVSPLQPGVGNIAADPQLLADNLHLSTTSPCRGAGTANSPGTTDFDGQTWADSPAIGCDEWHPEPVISIPPLWRVASDSRPGIRLLATVAGAGPFQCQWTWNGLPIQNDAHYSGAESTILLVRGVVPADAGNYQVVVSNASGVATSPPAPFVIRCADAAGAAPAPPYTTWATAASSIQDAIDAAQPGDLVLVTNGVYAVGGKSTVLGPLTNRVALDKAVVVASVNGAEVTTIQGQWDPVGTNGPAAIRCAWVTNGAVLDGFTLTGGATRAASSGQWDAFGGGVWCGSPDAVVANCVIAGNTAFRGGGGSWNGTLVNCTIKYNAVINSTGGQGGGAYAGVLSNCVLVANFAQNGGGFYGDSLYPSILNGCAIYGNEATTFGGGVYRASLVRCTISGNKASTGGGVMQGLLDQCIVWANTANSGANWTLSAATNTCASPLISGQGNFAIDPQLLDPMHLAVTSPCRGAGSSANSSGTDIDGEPWANPPSIGCDEVWENAPGGPLAVSASATPAEIAQTGVPMLQGTIAGRASRLAWDFGDGVVVTNASYIAPNHSWTNTGDYTVTFTAFNADHPEGVSTELLLHVIPLLSPSLSAGSLQTNSTTTLFTFSFDSQAGVTYLVEQTTNLAPPVVWSKVWSGIGTGGSLNVTDPNATDPMRFYRLRTQ